MTKYRFAKKWEQNSYINVRKWILQLNSSKQEKLISDEKENINY